MSANKSDKDEKLSDKVVIKGDKAVPNRLNVNVFYKKALYKVEIALKAEYQYQGKLTVA